MAVLEKERGKGIGAALIFGTLTLNVHIRSPAAHLYSRTGFSVAGAGRGPLGVAMSRALE